MNKRNEILSLSIYDQLGQRISYLRKKKKMSQLDLSIETGLSKSYLSDLERGKRNPSLKILNQIALSLGLSLAELFLGIDDFGSSL